METSDFRIKFTITIHKFIQLRSIEDSKTVVEQKNSEMNKHIRKDRFEKGPMMQTQCK